MVLFKNVSIKNKILAIVLFIVILTISLGFFIVTIRDVKNYKSDLLATTKMNTKIIGEYCVPALIFDDIKGATKILSKLDNLHYVNTGALYNKNGTLFASYKKNNSFFIAPFTKNNIVSAQEFNDNYLTITRRIIFKNQFHGILIIKVNTETLDKKITTHIFILLSILLGIIILAFLLTNRLQKIISKPILDLAMLTRKISSENNFSIKIERKTNDEIGILYDDFSNLLNQINTRDEARDKVEKKLLEAKIKAENADKLKSAFLANMSHEIRTPMNAILGFSELLSSNNVDVTEDEKNEYINLIKSNGNSLLNLINDIIDISKIEANQLKIKKKQCNINEVLNNLEKNYNGLKKQKNKNNIEIRIKNNYSNFSILTDPLRLQQILSNLIDNSLKFTENGFIEFGFIEQGIDTLLFYVKDTGIGMDEKDTNSVFDRFKKLDNDNTKLYRGTGLGLAICKSLVELLNGEIWVKSKKGIGSTFYFTLPNIKTKTINTQQISNKLNSKKINWTDKTILIVEDESANLIYLKEVLKSTHINILKAINGEDAVRLFKKNKNIDLVLMDIKLPKMDGYEASMKIKKINKKIPIILQSAFALNNEEINSFHIWIDEQLTKPINPNALLNVLAKYININ
ncbi:MAG: ATP-binding protein [Bacteroidales bacterium]|jgi:signal transduction histidine kinase|nr:ATP-binding protein [Bacteroidales bacterium]